MLEPVRDKTILNVNDREANRYALTRVLKAAGFHVLEAATGAEALEQARKRPELVVLDVNLPDMSGFEVAHRLKSDPATSDMLILHTSAISVRAHHRAEGLERGADGYLTEPFEPEELIATINALLRLGRAEAKARRAAREWQVSFEQLKRAESALRLLSDSSELLMSSLDYRTTLPKVARAAVNTLFDLCAIDLRGPEDAVERVAMAGRTGLEEHARAMAALTPRRENELGFIERALFKGEPTLRSDLTGAELELLAPDPADRGTLDRIAPRSIISVPMVMRDRVLGTVTVFSTTGRRCADDDLKVVQELARRAGLAIENARLYHEAQAALNTRDEFFSIASHELKNPLSALLLQLKLLQRELRRSNARPETVAAKVDAAERNATRMGELVQELLDTTRIRAGKLELRREPADLAIIARDVVHRLESEASAARTPFHVETQAEVVGNWDRSRIEQVVTNLVSNAIKYGGGNPVNVQVVREGDHARVTVRDGGIGIAPQDQARIFEPFERGRSTGAPGLGLGLYITRKIVEAHGGEIELTSAVGEGTTISFRLPI